MHLTDINIFIQEKVDKVWEENGDAREGRGKETERAGVSAFIVPILTRLTSALMTQPYHTDE